MYNKLQGKQREQHFIMSTLLFLGAINQYTGEYVYPKIANKKDNYVCPDCNKDLILVQGKIKSHHFRHKADNVKCKYYNQSTESQIHKDAKLLLKHILENNTNIQCTRECLSCNKIEVFEEILEMTDTSTIALEYRFEYNGLKIADVAHIDNGEILSIFEIYNTHKTCGKNRPEPWFEIDANELIRSVKDVETLRVLRCVRSEKCKNCIKIDDSLLRRFITPDINSDKFTYICVVFSKRNMIKELGGKWNNEHKVWYIPIKTYENHKQHIHTFGYKIIWRRECVECDGTRKIFDYPGYDMDHPWQYLSNKQIPAYKYEAYNVTCRLCSCYLCHKLFHECNCNYCEECNTLYDRKHHDCCRDIAEIKQLYDTIQKAKKMFSSWWLDEEFISPFLCWEPDVYVRDNGFGYDNGFDFGYYSACYECSDEEADIVIVHKGTNIKYKIDLHHKTYSEKFKDECTSNNVEVHYVDPVWILEQTAIPTYIQSCKIVAFSW